MKEFHYRIAWRTRSVRPGHHRSHTAGSGYEFRGHTTLIDYPDPRKLDIHATLHDPFGQYKVRQFSQTSTIPVFAIADLSASMAIGHKPQLLSELATAVAYSAYRTGDPFGFLGVNDQIALHFPLRLSKSRALELKRRLAQIRLQGGNGALHRLTAYLGTKRALIFLLSDFYFPLSEVQALLAQLQPHDVVPLVLGLESERQPPARWGWARLYDPETGRHRFLWLSPSSKTRLDAAFCDHRAQLTELCRRYGRPPLFVEDRFHPDRLTRYFLETCA
ncbi:hypothetical protein JCM13664_21780 [Methylothermus subterraneus]